jgi:hypothetical protein
LEKIDNDMKRLDVAVDSGYDFDHSGTVLDRNFFAM